MKKKYGIALMAIFFAVLLSVQAFAGTGNKNDLAYLGFNELSTGTIDTTDEIVYFEGDVPKQGATIANLLALASPSDVEDANGDLTVTRDAIVTRNLDLNGDLVGDGGGEISGMLADVLEVTTDTLTVAESGIWTIKTSATVSTLPAWATGIEYKFKSSGAFAYSVDVASTADTLYVGSLVLDAGDKITSSAVTGNTIHVVAGTSPNKWYATCYPNACSDGGS